MKYSSSNTSIATVNKDGSVLAKKSGTTVITAEINGVKTECKVTVREKSTSSSNSNPSNTTNENNSNTSNNNVNSNATVVSNPKISATEIIVGTDKGVLLEVTGHIGEVKWSTSNDKLSAFLPIENGKAWIYAWDEGVSTITAEVDGKKLTCKVIGKIVEKQAVLAKKTFDLINKERAKIGVAPLIWDVKLEEPVCIRAKEIYQKDSDDWWEAHHRLDGSSCFTVLDHLPTSECSEIIVGTQNPESAVAGWMNSPSHRESMLDPNKTHAAVAYCGGWTECLLVSYFD